MFAVVAVYPSGRQILVGFEKDATKQKHSSMTASPTTVRRKSEKWASASISSWPVESDNFKEEQI